MTKVLSVVSELFPFVKTGGLGDVAAALPVALRQHGVEVNTLIPGYPPMMAALERPQETCRYDDLFGGPARLVAGHAGGLDLIALDAPHLYDRPGSPYVGPDGRDWPDNAVRFGALGWIAAAIGLGDIPALRPDIIHAHDWQAGLTMAYLAYADRPRPGTVLTIHNLAFQGQFPADLLGALRLPPHAYAIEGVEYYGTISFLKAGLQFADRITTVSPSYAAEIQAPENGCGFDALLRARSGVLCGILNGIDVEVWNPATDARIPSRYDASSLAARAANKRALQGRFGLRQDPDRLLFAVIARLTSQKGIDLLAAAVPTILDLDAQLAVLGTGERDLEQHLLSIAKDHRGSVGCIIGYDEDLAHLTQAGTDALVVPSRFEPCGLTQLCALRYGAVPLVAKVGGLADTVIDVAATGSVRLPNGIQFSPVTQEALEAALRRAAVLWCSPSSWGRVQQNGMATDVSWSDSAGQYARLYAGLLDGE